MNESGRTREAEARNNLSQDGEAVYTHVQDAGERAPQVLASRRECARKDGEAVLADRSSLK